MSAPATTPALTNSLLTGTEWSPAQLHGLFHLSGRLKTRPKHYREALTSRVLALVFERPSLRTRVTFEAAIASLGGTSIFLDYTAAHLGDRESIPDVARNLEGWIHCVVARVFEQKTLDQLAGNARVPVLNALSDRFHPCQALADFFTLQERFGDLGGLKLAYVGGGNNVCHSLISIGARAGAHLRIATPVGYEPDPAVLAEAEDVARETHGRIEISRTPEEAVASAQAVYTDIWASMGREDETALRQAAFAGYQVNEKLFSQTAPDAVFMHCLPVHRGLEVTDGVIDSPRSIVFDQAENHLHVQKAILLTLVS